MTSRLLAIALVAVLIASLPASAGALTAGAADVPSPETQPSHERVANAPADSGASSDPVLHRTTTLRHLPDRPGTFETEMEFRVPDPVVDLEITLHSRAEIESTAGFETTDDGTLRWIEETDRPTVRFTMPANRTGDVGHHAPETASDDRSPLETSSTDRGAFDVERDGHRLERDEATDRQREARSSGERYTFVDTGEWGVVQVPGVDVSLRQTESVAHEETVVVDGPGATGGDIAFFGPVTEHETTVDGETIQLAVPDAADPSADPTAVLETLAYASESLDVGARPDEVFVVAVPADVDWGPQGVQYGDGDAWVVADVPLEHPANVWIHEYVHVRQDFETDDATRWLVEAQAEYYAASYAFEKGLIEFDEFAGHLERGEHTPYTEGVLAEPASWSHDRTDYVKGRLVYAEIDRVLRLETDGDRTLEDVFRVMNAREGTLTESAFLDLLERAGGKAVRETAQRYTQTEATPETWDVDDHAAAFDLSGATFEYGVASEPIEVAGEPWEIRGQSGDDVIAVPAGPTVTVPVEVENAGDRAGTYDATLAVDGDVVAYEQSTLDANDRTVERLEWTPHEPGEYELRVGTQRLTVHVRTVSSLDVTDLSVEPETPRPDEPVTITATVASADSIPGAAVLEFRTGDGVVAEEIVGVAPGDAETVEATVRFDEEGQYEVVVGDRSTVVAVEPAPPPAELEEVPGFGVGSAIAALFATLVAAFVAVRGARRRPQ
ncbi:hypothetical protein [Natrarchaeobius oligotrophus]|uniref:CARDB domain-containing protein n=1 Tax=Natrarchaeobius chitinivorans TaxID=1679083 RepID=A0A3N6M2N7_NATCH|nr:hypothetical protein [Natrarchaeobius chitinivorans]RQG96077.1 hypothetical protein EA472_20935 [Natrarchaeobius chitinivorans]